MADPVQSFSSNHPLIVTSVVLFIVTGLTLGVWFALSEEDDIAEWFMKRFFRAKAKAEEKALENIGQEKAQSFLKDQLKKNPEVSNEKLNSISSGLGDEAAKQFGKGGLGAGIGKAFD